MCSSVRTFQRMPASAGPFQSHFRAFDTRSLDLRRIFKQGLYRCQSQMVMMKQFTVTFWLAAAILGFLFFEHLKFPSHVRVWGNILTTHYIPDPRDL